MRSYNKRWFVIDDDAKKALDIKEGEKFGVNNFVIFSYKFNRSIIKICGINHMRNALCQ